MASEPVINYYSLTKPPEVSTNISDLDNISEGTEVILTVNVPAEMTVESFKVNGTEVVLVDNTYTFNITSNTVVTVSFKNISEQNYYSLTKPDEVSANVSDLNNILENKEVTLTFDFGDKEVDYVLVNGIKVNLVNGKYTFNITSDTIVEIVYLASWEQLSKANVEGFFNNLETTLFKEGTMNVVISTEYDTYLVLKNGLFIIDESLNVLEGLLTTKNYDGGVLFGDSSIYLDSAFYYEVMYNVANNDIINEVVSYRDTSFQGLEMFGVFYTDNPFMPTGLQSINDLIEFIFTEFNDDILEGNKFDYINFYESENLFKIELKTGNIDIFDLFRGMLDYDSQTEITLIFDNLKLDSINVKFADSITLDVSYTEQELVVDPRIKAIDSSLVEYNTYYYHLGDDDTIIVELDKEYANGLTGISLIEVYNLTKPYKEDKRVVGYYLDKNFLTEIEPEDFLTDELNIYVKWEDYKTPEELTEDLMFNDGIWLKSIDGGYTYYEDEDYIYYAEYNTIITVIDKANEKRYQVTSYGDNFTSYESPYFDSKPFLYDVLTNEPNKNFIPLKGLLINLEHDLMFVGNFINIEEERFPLLGGDLYLKNEDPFEYELIADYINEAVIDEVATVLILTDDYYVDMNNLEEEIAFYFIYSSSYSEFVSLDAALDRDLTFEVDFELDEIRYQYDNKDYFYNYLKFYDSNRGKAVIVDDINLYYFEELDDLPTLELSKYHIVNNYVDEFGNNINTFQDLENSLFYKKFISIYSVIDILESEDAINKLKESLNLKIDYLGYEVNYNHLTRTYLIKKDNNTLVVKIDDDYYHFSGEHAYLKIPVENFNFNDLFYGSWFSLFNNFYNMFGDLLERLILFDQLFNTNQIAEKTEFGYVFSNDLHIMVQELGIYINIGSNYRIVENDLVVEEDVEVQRLYNFEMINNVSLPIVLNVSDTYSFKIFSYNFKDYATEGVYELDEHNEVNFDKLFDDNNIVEGNNNLYINYVEILEPTMYFSSLVDNDKYILQGEFYLFKVNKELSVEIYFEEELLYLIDLIEDKTYYHLDNNLYELYLSEEIFNIVLFTNNITDEMFYYDDNNSQYTFSGDIYVNLYLSVDVRNNYISFYNLEFSTDNYEIVISEFESLDLSSFNFELLTIEQIVAHAGGAEALSIDELQYYLGIELTFNDQTSKFYYYDEFIESYNGYYEDGFIYFVYFEELIEIDLKDFNISVYDPSFDQVVLFYTAGTFSYLSELDELPILEDKDYELFKGWSTDYYGITPMSLEDIKQLNDDIIGLFAVYEIPGVDKLFIHLENKGTVELELNYRNYFENQSTRVFAEYSYSDDRFLVGMNRNYTLLIGFEDDFVYVKTNNFYVKYDPAIFTLTSNNLDYSNISNFTEVISDLLEYRKLLKNEFAGVKVVDFYNYNGEVYRLNVDTFQNYINILTPINNRHMIRVVEEREEQIDVFVFTTTLFVKTEFSETDLIVSADTHFRITGFSLAVDGYIFDDYYFKIGHVGPGGIAYEVPVKLKDTDFTQEVKTYNIEGVYESIE